jgi:serine/threonine-protein kinase RsbW
VFQRERLSVPAMRQVLGDTLRRLGVNEDSVADILLAASEACANVVLHAGQSVRAYEVAATVGRFGCRVEIRDSGRAVRGAGPSLARGFRRGVPPWRKHLAESGRGFAVMRGCVDNVTFRSAPGQGTSVVLRKRIDWDPPLPPVAAPALGSGRCSLVRG